MSTVPVTRFFTFHENRSKMAQKRCLADQKRFKQFEEEKIMCHPVHLPIFVAPHVHFVLHAQETRSSAKWKTRRIIHSCALCLPVQEERLAAAIVQDFLDRGRIQAVGHVVLVPIALGNVHKLSEYLDQHLARRPKDTSNKGQ